MGIPGPVARLRAELRDRALELPEAWEDHPWGESVVKVRKKIFVFLGVDDGSYPPGVGLKLLGSLEEALGLPGVAPMGYGLGKAGWVMVSLQGRPPPGDLLLDWVEESYRLVAPKTLVGRLDTDRAV